MALTQDDVQSVMQGENNTDNPDASSNRQKAKLLANPFLRRMFNAANPTSGDSSGANSMSADPNDPFSGAAVMFGRPYALTLGAPPKSNDGAQTDLTGAGADGAANSSAGGSSVERVKPSSPPPAATETHGQTAGHGNAITAAVAPTTALPSDARGDYNPDLSAVLGSDNGPYAASNVRFDRTGKAVVPGGGNPIINFFARLGRGLGIASPELAPVNGQAPSPEAFDQAQHSRLARAMRLVGGLGNAMSQFGSPREAQLGEQRSEFAAQLPLRQLEIERQLEMERNEIAFRNAMIGLRRAGLDEKTANDHARVQVALDAAQRRGLGIRVGKDGNYYVIDARTGHAMAVTPDNAGDVVAAMSGFPAPSPSYARPVNAAAPEVSGSPTAQFLQAPQKSVAAKNVKTVSVVGPDGKSPKLIPQDAYLKNPDAYQLYQKPTGHSSKPGKVAIDWGKDGQAIGITDGSGKFWTGNEPDFPQNLAGALYAAQLHPKQPAANKAKPKGKIVF